MANVTLINQSTTSTDYVWYGTEYAIYDAIVTITNLTTDAFGYDIVSSQNGHISTITSVPVTNYGANSSIALTLTGVVGRLGVSLVNSNGNTVSVTINSINADSSNNSALVERTLYNYTPLSLPAGTATDIISAVSTQGFKIVPPLTGKTIKFALNYNIYCPTASTSWTLTLKLGTTTLYTGTTTGQQQIRKLEFILDQTNNYIYLQRNTLVDNAAAVLVTKVAFTDWANAQALSLTITPTAAALLIGLEAGYAE